MIILKYEAVARDRLQKLAPALLPSTLRRITCFSFHFAQMIENLRRRMSISKI